MPKKIFEKIFTALNAFKEWMQHNWAYAALKKYI